MLSFMLRVHSIETFGTHEGPGIRLVLFLQGCNFRCLYCHNADTQALTGGKEMSDSEIIDLLNKEKTYFSNGGGLTISGGEPLLQAKDLIPLFEKVRQFGYNIALDTNGSIATDVAQEVFDLSDLVILDVKHINTDSHKKLTGAEIGNTLAMAKYREESGKPMWLRYVLVPGYNDQPETIVKWAEHFKNYRTIERVELIPFHTLGSHKFKKLGRKNPLEGLKPPANEKVENTIVVLERYFKNVLVQ